MGENLGGYVHDGHTLYGRESRGDTYTTDPPCMGENLGGYVHDGYTLSGRDSRWDTYTTDTH